MSRAFVKEQDEGLPGDLPERQVSGHPNYVTPAGRRQLEAAAGELQARRLELLSAGEDPAVSTELAHIDRDLRYYAARLESAIPVDPAGQPRDEVAFGAAGPVQAGGAERPVTIVGEDEADRASGRISYVSPLARALLGAHAGDEVLWRRPAGDRRLRVTGISYPAG
jgi:transcription elongation GreA/GreB family factor